MERQEAAVGADESGEQIGDAVFIKIRRGHRQRLSIALLARLPRHRISVI